MPLDVYCNHIDATIVGAGVSVDVLKDFVAELLRDVEEGRAGILSPSRPKESLEAFETSSEREPESGGIVKVEAGLLDATELDNCLEDIAAGRPLDAQVFAISC
jgi:hypothetical protein